MGELLIEESCNNGGTGTGIAVHGMVGIGGRWSVERRFRVTEVFLAVLWVWLFAQFLHCRKIVCSDMLKI